jgi:ABC-type phosphate transport system ATPase subunit
MLEATPHVKYRMVLLDENNNEVGSIVTIPIDERSIIVVMPQSGDMFPMAMCDNISVALEYHGIKGIVFHIPVSFARLERTEP